MSKEMPKIIHYVWFGRNQKPDVMKDCIASWKKFFPGWEIKEWNEENYDVSVIPYTEEAYRAQKWAFVSDYVRFDVLYKFGGIYVDIDVEFIRPLPNSFLECEAFTGFESAGFVSPGLIFGAHKGFSLLKKILEIYNNEHFEIRKDGNYKTVNMYLTELLLKDGLKLNDTFQRIDGLSVYPSEYFCGYDTDIDEPAITCNTICWHHYLGSWVKITFKSKVQKILRKIIGVKKYKKLLILSRKLMKK